MSEEMMNDAGATIGSGCPSLGLPKLPGGFDGVEPFAKMNAEALFGDLVDIVLKAAREAPKERTAREAFYRTVLGDVAHAVAGVVPSETVGEKERSAGTATPAVGGKGAFNGVRWRIAKTPYTVVMTATNPTTGRKFSAELSSCGEAYLYDNGSSVCSVTFEDAYRSFRWSYAIIRRAMNGLVSVGTRHSRRTQNNKARRAGILTPCQEIAETVKRQKEEA